MLPKQPRRQKQLPKRQQNYLRKQRQQQLRMTKRSLQIKRKRQDNRHPLLHRYQLKEMTLLF
jgi:hypothetical protein